MVDYTAKQQSYLQKKQNLEEHSKGSHCPTIFLSFLLLDQKYHKSPIRESEHLSLTFQRLNQNNFRNTMILPVQLLFLLQLLL